jgi:hypothetical protein
MYEIPVELLDVNIKGVEGRHREMVTMAAVVATVFRVSAVTAA